MKIWIFQSFFFYKKWGQEYQGGGREEQVPRLSLDQPEVVALLHSSKLPHRRDELRHRDPHAQPVL